MRKLNKILTTKGGEKKMKKLTIFLMVISLIFLSVSPSIFAAYANVGPTTNFDGDVGVPTGCVYKINDVLLSIDDITTEDLIIKADFKDEDWGDMSVATNVVTIDEDVIDKANFKDEDWGDLSVSTNSVTLDNDVVGTAELADEDWGDVNITGGVAQVQDLTITSEAAGDIIYFDGSNWIHLAKDEGKYLQSGAAAVAWATPTMSANFVLHCMDMDAADVDYVHAAIVGTGASQDILTAITNPDYGRNITVTSTAGSVGVVTITGTTADGTTSATDAITIVDGGTAQGVKAYVYVSNINVSDALISPEEVTIGIGDLIGLQNAISAESDIYMKTVDGIEEYGEISGNANVTYNTLNCSTVEQNEDLTVLYHP